jgi:hypothetical protein
MRRKINEMPQRQRRYLAAYVTAIPPAVLAPPTKPVTSGAVPADCRTAKRDPATTFPIKLLSQLVQGNLVVDAPIPLWIPAAMEPVKAFRERRLKSGPG